MFLPRFPVRRDATPHFPKVVTMNQRLVTPQRILLLRGAKNPALQAPLHGA